MTTTTTTAPVAVAVASPINVTVNQIVTGKVSRRKDRNAQGLLIEIEGNPMAYLPVIALAGRNRSERDARFASLVNAAGSEIEVAIVSAGMEEIKGVAVPRIKLSETKVFALRDEAARIERENALIDAVSAITVGEVVSLTVSGPATTKSDKNDGSMHCFGVFVDVAGIKGLLHVSEVAGDHPKAQRTRLDSMATGSTVEVEIIEARVEGGRAFVRVSEKAAAVKKAMERLPVGSKVSATVVGSDVVGNEHGLIVNIGGIKAFLPEADANVTNIESLTKSRGQTVKVTITAGFVDGMVKVTRKGK
jgi:ribosomal protein S1